MQSHTRGQMTIDKSRPPDGRLPVFLHAVLGPANGPG